ncbi:MAG: aminotransferase class I/II-fold pyridoxal phosphate-dependent enzyme, partial [Synechococcales cyanobacterium RM1_1_8]|nr:aminotransferase class I/II-fold pyridoxal phosphate-dependent enzyme [Synechococcales cyanobacterium RM1_1_8]
MAQPLLHRPQHGGNLAWAAALAGCLPAQLLDFSASISPLGPPPTVLGALQAAIPQLGAYPDPEYLQLRTGLGAGHGLGPDWVLPGNGAAELITWAGRELAQCQRVYALVPGFADYGRALTAFQARLEPWPLDVAGMADTGQELADLALADLALAGLAKVLTADDGLLLNNPHNPTGRMFTREAIGPLLETGALVVVDEAFMDFVSPGRQQSVIDWIGGGEGLGGSGRESAGGE